MQIATGHVFIPLPPLLRPVVFPLLCLAMPPAGPGCSAAGEVGLGTRGAPLVEPRFELILCLFEVRHLKVDKRQFVVEYFVVLILELDPVNYFQPPGFLFVVVESEIVNTTSTPAEKRFEAFGLTRGNRIDKGGGSRIWPAWCQSAAQTTDAHFLALVQAHGAVLATLDRGLPGATPCGLFHGGR